MSKSTHNCRVPEFNRKSSSLIAHLLKQIEKSGVKFNCTQGQVIDELEILQSALQQDCQCRKLVRILVQAANFSKWIRLLLSEHESKLTKYSCFVPKQFQDMRTELTELIQLLQRIVLTKSHQKYTYDQDQYINKVKVQNTSKTKIITKRLRSFKHKLMKPNIRTNFHTSNSNSNIIKSVKVERNTQIKLEL